MMITPFLFHIQIEQYFFISLYSFFKYTSKISYAEYGDTLCPTSVAVLSNSVVQGDSTTLKDNLLWITKLSKILSNFYFCDLSPLILIFGYFVL